MGSLRSDFYVDSKGHCFLCLDPITSSTSSATSFHSFHNLTRYLNLDTEKVFSEKEAIPQHLLEKARRSELKVELCGGCGVVTGRFSELFRQLEKIQLEVLPCLDYIRGRILLSEQSEKVEEFRRLSWNGLRGKLEIVEGLRSEAMRKCSKALNLALPRVSVKKLAQDASDEDDDNDNLSHTSSSSSPSLSPPDATEEAPDDPEENPSYPEVFSLEAPATFYIVNDCRDVDVVVAKRKRNHNDLLKIRPGPGPSKNRIKASSSSSSKKAKKKINKGTGPTDKPRLFTQDSITGHFKCGFCTRQFDNYKATWSHYNRNHRRNKTTSEVKHITITNYSDVWSRDPKTGLYKCLICSKQFNKYASLNSHFIRNHPQARSKPAANTKNKMKKVISSKIKQAKQKMGGVGIGSAVAPSKSKKSRNDCGICGKKLSCFKSVKRHINAIHLMLKQHFCDLCGREFSQVESLNRHLRTVHSKEEVTAAANEETPKIVAVSSSSVE